VDEDCRWADGTNLARPLHMCVTNPLPSAALASTSPTIVRAANVATGVAVFTIAHERRRSFSLDSAFPLQEI